MIWNWWRRRHRAANCTSVELGLVPSAKAMTIGTIQPVLTTIIFLSPVVRTPYRITPLLSASSSMRRPLDLDHCERVTYLKISCLTVRLACLRASCLVQTLRALRIDRNVGRLLLLSTTCSALHPRVTSDSARKWFGWSSSSHSHHRNSYRSALHVQGRGLSCHLPQPPIRPSTHQS